MVCNGCGFSWRIQSAGRVKMAPATMPPDTPPMPVMMTFSRSMDRGGAPERLSAGYTRASPIARIEIGMAASSTCPTLRPE